MTDKPARGRGFRLVHLLLAIPFVTLWVPFYNRSEPSIAGIPFFYWYQMLWIVLTAILLLIVFRAQESEQ